MGERISFLPSWRGASQPVDIYVNPDARDFRTLFDNSDRGIRFVLAGNATLYAGNAYEFIHPDAHTHFKGYSSNIVRMGEMFLEKPEWMTDEWARINCYAHIDRSTTSNAAILQESSYSRRGFGILYASRQWRRMLSGTGHRFEVPPPLDLGPDVIVDPERPPQGSWYVFLHDDGHLYFFPDDGETHHVHDRRISEAEEIVNYEAGRDRRAGDSPVGFVASVNHNGTFVSAIFSDAADPFAFVADNIYWWRCFRGTDPILEKHERGHFARART